LNSSESDKSGDYNIFPYDEE
jgi:hypothetical protein